MLPLTSPSEALFLETAFLHFESTPSSPCCCSDPLSLAKAWLPLTLTLSHFMIWTDGSVPFPFSKGGSAVLANCSLCGTEATLSPFRQAKFAQVFPLKPAPFWKLFSGLGSTNKSAISLLLSDSRHPTCPLFRLSFYLKLSGKSGRNCLLFRPVLLGYYGSPNTRFSRGTTRLMSWPEGERYSCPLQSIVVSFLFSLVSTLLFSRTGGVLSI